MTNNEIVKVAVDAYHGKVQKYSVGESQDVLRQALIEMNDGETKLNPRKLRGAKGDEMFALIEEILKQTVVEGLTDDDYFNALVDFRNVAEGDKNVFVIEDNVLFMVSDLADGTQGVQRQRISGVSEVSIPTSRKVIKIYEELDRVLAGRIDFNEFIDLVAKSFRQDLLEKIQALWNSASADDFGGAVYFPAAGTYDEGALLDVIAHVEAAANGEQATILCTKKGARMLGQSLQADSAKEDIYNQGYVGKFFGTPVVITPQRHKFGSTDFILPDNVFTVVAGSQKPIKVVYEGDPMVVMGNPMDNADLTYEYLYSEKYGAAIVLAGGNAGVGRYETV